MKKAGKPWLILAGLAVAALGYEYIDLGFLESGKDNSVATRPVPVDDPKRLSRLAGWGATDEAVALELDEKSLARNYYLVFDGSGSMSSVECSNGAKKIEAARAAVGAFARNVPAEDNLGMMAFDDNGLRELVPLGSNNSMRIHKALNEVRAGAGTPLGKAIEQSHDQLQAQAMRQRGYGEYHIVVITDGEASDTGKMESQVETILANTPITIHTIGFCIDDNHSLNQPGRVIYKAANNPDELAKGLETVLAETEEFTDIKF